VGEGARLAKLANVRELVLCQREPIQADAAVREKERRAKALFPDVIAAHEGLTLEI